MLSVLKNNNFLLRLLSSLVLFPIVILLLSLQGFYGEILIMIVGVLALLEWAKLCGQSKFLPLKKVIWLGLGSLYIGSACYSFWSMYYLVQIILVVLASTSDISAYIIGRWLKGPKLAPHISPNKTWSGALGSIGGVIILFILSGTLWFFVYRCEGDKLGLGDFLSINGTLMICGVFFGIIAQGGDLLQSWCKRKMGVKDSGSLIPGHGGILDRIDSLLAVSLASGLFVFIVMGKKFIKFSQIIS